MRFKIAALSEGLVMNCTKTKFMTLNIPEEASSSAGNQQEKVHDFVYREGWIATTERDLRVRKTLRCHKLKNIWKSGLRRGMKIRLLVATVESILLYSSETWTINESLMQQIDGCFTRMLRMALSLD